MPCSHTAHPNEDTRIATGKAITIHLLLKLLLNLRVQNLYLNEIYLPFLINKPYLITRRRRHSSRYLSSLAHTICRETHMHNTLSRLAMRQNTKVCGNLFRNIYLMGTCIHVTKLWSRHRPRCACALKFRNLFLPIPPHHLRK